MFYSFFKKIIEILLSVIFILTVVFFIFKSLPGNSFEHEQQLNTVVLNQIQNSSSQISVFDQYKMAVQHLFTFQWGESQSHPGVQVLELIVNSLIRTLKVVGVSFLFIIIVSFLVLYLFYSLNSQFLRAFIFYFNLTFISLPGLFIAPLMIYIFAIKFEWFPVALLDSPAHYILPVLCLSLRPLALMLRQMIIDIDEKKLSDYVRTGVAKGLHKEALILRYYFKPSLIVWISIGTNTLIGLISGNFLIEYLFSIPGVGSLFVQSLEQRDFNVLVALIFVFSTLIISITQLSDFITSVFFPQWNQRTESL